MDQAQLIQQKLKLDQELQEYIKTHGFNYAEYCAPPPGSWMESYRARVQVINDQLLPKLQSWVGPAKAA